MLANMFQLTVLFLICFIQCIYAFMPVPNMGKATGDVSMKDVLTALIPKPNIVGKAETLHSLTGKKVKPNSTPPAKIGMIYKLPPGISVGKYLKIEGFAPPGENIFEINLQKGSNAPTGDRDFHLSVRFDTETIVFNTLKNNKWQEEQVHEIFPIDTGETTRKFDITITLEEDFYEIDINDFHYSFLYRIPLEEQHLDFLVISPSFWVTSLQLGSNF